MPTINLEPEIACLSCGKGPHEVRRMIALNATNEVSLFLCDGCVDLCYELIHDDEPATTQIQPL